MPYPCNGGRRRRMWGRIVERESPSLRPSYRGHAGGRGETPLAIAKMLRADLFQEPWSLGGARWTLTRKTPRAVECAPRGHDLDHGVGRAVARRPHPEQR